MHIPDGAVDLGKIKENAAKREADEARKEAAKKELEENQAALEAASRARSWDGRMQRAFKGIMPRPQRRAALGRALVRYNEEHPDDQ